ncbi:MAG: hypothetical protein EBZ48_18160, partial [Proteobacteria bacterium]|nr:hypothetical protein [Pseudomonadota bacterium]
LDAREPIVLLKAGTCPSESLSANWMKASFDTAPTNGTPSSSDSFGGATFTNTSGTYSASLTKYAFHNGASMSSGPGPTGTCTDGVLTFASAGGTGTMYMTSNGGALVKSTGGIIFAAPKTTGATLATLDGTYTALVFSGNKYTGIPQIFPGKLTFSSGTGSGFQITDAETDSVSGSGPTFALSYVASSDGLYRGTITNGHGANHVLEVSVVLQGLVHVEDVILDREQSQVLRVVLAPLLEVHTPLKQVGCARGLIHRVLEVEVGSDLTTSIRVKDEPFNHGQLFKPQACLRVVRMHVIHRIKQLRHVCTNGSGVSLDDRIHLHGREL